MLTPSEKIEAAYNNGYDDGYEEYAPYQSNLPYLKGFADGKGDRELRYELEVEAANAI